MGKVPKSSSQVGQIKGGKSKVKAKGKPKEGILKGKIGSLPDFDSTGIPSQELAEAGHSNDEATPEQPKASQFFWQDPSNVELLHAASKRRAAQRSKHQTIDSFRTRAGVTLARAGIAPPSQPVSSVDFLHKELFDRRKRKRSCMEKDDRNVLRGHKVNAHCK
eukprot:gnl/MRDRNA2_/MRDRNA2_28549_c0_seq1.p1 gnl/MRDRNA2_/MRDRNA2_28549_c0~~gnl/MRDRNA2_/MRDRNA2_28549_c0_seq1.p1  ORF type:complete len:163 (+),score=28.99 gnl/MRDRNA2_/MRDRNA2_28549_c0_seq1:73-561(+)